MKEFKYFSRAGFQPPARSTAGREFPSQLPDPTTVLRSAAALLKQFADSAPSLSAPRIRNRGLAETPSGFTFTSLLPSFAFNFSNNFIPKRWNYRRKYISYEFFLPFRNLFIRNLYLLENEDW